MPVPAHSPTPFEPDAKFALVVDDIRVLRKSLKAFLQHHGFLVVTAASGAEAVAIAPLFPFSVILTDIQMPGMDGFETARCIRALGGWLSRAPIIAVSGLFPPPSVAECAAAGLDTFVAKESPPEMLLETMTRLMREHPLDRSAEMVDDE